MKLGGVKLAKSYTISKEETEARLEAISERYKSPLPSKVKWLGMDIALPAVVDSPNAQFILEDFFSYYPRGSRISLALQRLHQPNILRAALRSLGAIFSIELHTYLPVEGKPLILALTRCAEVWTCTPLRNHLNKVGREEQKKLADQLGDLIVLLRHSNGVTEAIARSVPLLSTYSGNARNIIMKSLANIALAKEDARKVIECTEAWGSEIAHRIITSFNDEGQERICLALASVHSWTEDKEMFCKIAQLADKYRHHPEALDRCVDHLGRMAIDERSMLDVRDRADVYLNARLTA